jgi:CubicO group peptidase (beta-lactamase class C family)
MGYHILGFICSKVGGKFYGDQLQEKIFSPLNMKARIISERDIVLHRANGYDVVDGKIKNQDWVSPTLNTTADGSIYLSAHDYALWNIALEKEFPLSSDIKNAMWEPVRLNNGTTYNYGYGWHTRTENGHLIVEHSGAWQGFTSKIIRVIDKNISIVVLLNRSSYNPDNISYKIAKYYVPDLK